MKRVTLPSKHTFWKVGGSLKALQSRIEASEGRASRGVQLSGQAEVQRM